MWCKVNHRGTGNTELVFQFLKKFFDLLSVWNRCNLLGQSLFKSNFRGGIIIFFKVIFSQLNNRLSNIQDFFVAIQKVFLRK
ncbi:MAG TPA: hypothetical protein DDZ79_09555 [Aequorivita sp.]|nr:hypothetical protein [Aequorivita sp.]